MEKSIDNYKQAWTRADTLDGLNKRIHDGAESPEDLIERARRYRKRLISEGFPMATPPKGARMMELGSGVGWIMQAMLEEFDLSEIVGLDISSVMIEKAQERFKDPRARFVLYDGFVFPFEDHYFDNIYSAAAIQHINKDIAFLLFKEMFRCLKPGGHATLHFLSMEHIKVTGRDWAEQVKRHIEGSPLHHLYLYTAEELLILFTEHVGVSDFDIRAVGSNLFVHFSKGGENRLLRPELEKRVRFHKPKEIA